MEEVLHLVFEFSPWQSLCRWQCVSRSMKKRVERRVDEVLRLKAPDMTAHQRNTLEYMVPPVHPAHMDSVLKRYCVICSDPWKGRIDEEWGVHGHRKCINMQLTMVSGLRHRLPTEHMRSIMPIEIRDDRSIYGLPWHTYDVFWDNMHHCVPKEWTVEWYDKTQEHAIGAYLQEKERTRKRRRSANARLEYDLAREAEKRFGTRKCQLCVKKNAIGCSSGCCGDCCGHPMCPRHPH